jgi:hypothetical protein
MVYKGLSKTHTLCIQIVHVIVQQFVRIIGHIYFWPWVTLVQRPVAVKTRGVEAILLSPEWVGKIAKMLTVVIKRLLAISLRKN